MQTGLPVEVSCPVGESLPLPASTEKLTMLSLSSLSAYSRRPSGESVKKRGVRPPVDTASTKASRPLSQSMRNKAMLSLPRFEA